MDDPVVQLEDSRLAVQPGGQVRTQVTVANPGQVVEGFRLEVLGAAAAWAEVTPPELQVYPHQDATALVVFTPPEGRTTPSGTVAFAVRAESVVDGSRSATAEGDLDVGAVFGLQSRLTPVTSTGRWSAAHAVALTNWGNVPERLRVTALDPDEQLAFLVHPEVVDLPVGASAVVSVQVRARRPTVRGVRLRRAFQVVAEPDATPSGPPPPPGADPRRAVLDGVLEVKPILSRATVTGGTMAFLAVGGLTAWALLAPVPAPTLAAGLDPPVVTPTQAGPTTDPGQTPLPTGPEQTPPPPGPGATPDPTQPGGTPPPTPGPGATEPAPAGDLRPDEWIVVVRITPTSQRGRDEARADEEALNAAGFTTGRLINDEYPDSDPRLAGGERSEILYVRTSDGSQESAVAFCGPEAQTALGGLRLVICQPTEPGPRQG